MGRTNKQLIETVKFSDMALKLLIGDGSRTENMDDTRDREIRIRMGLVLNKIDYGRLIIIPVFSLLLIINILGIGRQIAALEPVSAIKIAKLANCILTAAYYALLVFLYVIRSSAKSTTKSFFVRNIAVISTFMPLTIPFLQEQTDSFSVILLSSIVAIFGMSISLYSLGSLGNSLSIIPQARSLVQTGAYKIVRHPLYLGELIAVFGIVLSRLSFATSAVLLLFAGLLAYRAFQEEKFLIGIFPEYRTYVLKTARLIPGIF